jgi:hypothetical protein
MLLLGRWSFSRWLIQFYEPVLCCFLSSVTKLIALAKKNTQQKSLSHKLIHGGGYSKQEHTEHFFVRRDAMACSASPRRPATASPRRRSASA